MGDNYGYSDIPYRQREVLVSTMRIDIERLFDMIKSQKIILWPDSGQKLNHFSTSKRDQRSEFVESVLLGFPIPPFYVFEVKYGDWIVAEGHNRLEALVQFLDGQYALEELRILDDLNGCRFIDLSSSDRRRLLYGELHVHIIRNDMHPAFQFEIMRRLNRTGTVLSDQELRSLTGTVERSDFLSYLVTRSSLMQLFPRLNKVKLQDQETVLRYLAFRYWGVERYRGDLNWFLNRFYHEGLDELLSAPNVMNDFIEEMQLLCEVIDHSYVYGSKHMKRLEIRLMFFDLMTVLFRDLKYVYVPTKELLRLEIRLQELYDENREFRDTFHRKPWEDRQVYIRFKTWEKALEHALRGDW